MTKRITAKIAAISALTAILSIPSVAMAEVDGQSASGNLVHRVSHTLAASRSYSHSANAGYKWAKGVSQTQSVDAWAAGDSAQSGYKWNAESSADKAKGSAYASNAEYQWNSMSFSEQASYKWGQSSIAEQAANKWWLR